MDSLTLDNIRLVKTEEGNIGVLFAYDIESDKGMCCILKTESSLHIGPSLLTKLTILSLSEMSNIITDEYDSDKRIRNTIGLLLESNFMTFWKTPWKKFDFKGGVMKVNQVNKQLELAIKL
ncbi:MAG: hypothetical protein CMF80_07880 [Candidatus Marinimicrobia bacterium]|nr:hypothetical protein [Candidatus Neomarinimicrobiota bacterium]|tara:strand:+ start:349 stop:711 length:363 start_codon:yes stop_codon:yes gene_type:complete